MSKEKPPTEKELGSACRPVVYLQGLLNDCRLENDQPFTGCPFAHHVGSNRFCKHPLLLATGAQESAPKATKTAASTGSNSHFGMKPAVPPSKTPPRLVLQEKYPQLLERIELMWGSIELHEYFKHSNRNGFPPDVLLALDEIDSKHRAILKANGKLDEDIPEKPRR